MSIKKYEVAFFDFDGTISASYEGITKSARYSLNSFGIKVDDLSELECFVGPPLEDTFSSEYGFDENQTKLAVEKFREYYIEHGILQQNIYKGIFELITGLKSYGITPAIATCKPTHLTKIALKRYGIIDFLNPIVGSRLDGTRKSKFDVLKEVISRVDGVEKSKMVMIGDRAGDLMAASDLGIDSIGVLYGYGSETELSACKPTHLVDSVSKLGGILEV